MKKTNNEVTMNLIITMIRFGIMERPEDFPLFMVWSRNVMRYSSKYGIKSETERA